MFKRILSVSALVLALILSTLTFGGGAAPRALAAPADAPAAAQRISFPPGGTSFTLSTTLTQGVAQSYVLGIGAGQNLYLTLYGSVMAQVFDPVGTSLAGPTGQQGPWGTAATTTGDYTVTLTGSGAATVIFYVPPFALPVPWPQPLPGAATRIWFARGASSATFSASLASGVPSSYLVRVAAGQQMFVTLNGSATASLLDPWGRSLAPAAAAGGQWQFNLPWFGDYQLVLNGTGVVAVTVYVPPLAPAPATATRIRFLPGNASTTLTATLPASYVLRIMAGQTLYIQVDDLNAIVSVTGPFGNSLNTVQSGRPGLWVATGWYPGDYTISIQGTGTTGLTVYVPPL